MSHADRVARLEAKVPGAFELYDAAGHVIWQFVPDPRSPWHPALDAFEALMRGVREGDEQIQNTLLRTRAASRNFAHLWEIPRALVNAPCSENPASEKAGIIDAAESQFADWGVPKF